MPTLTFILMPVPAVFHKITGPFYTKELLDSEFWEIGLFNDMYLYWQTSLMQPEDGMDKIPKAFLNHLGPNTKLQLNIRQSINLKVDWFWPATT